MRPKNNIPKLLDRVIQISMSNMFHLVVFGFRFEELPQPKFMSVL